MDRQIIHYLSLRQEKCEMDHKFQKRNTEDCFIICFPWGRKATDVIFYILLSGDTYRDRTLYWMACSKRAGMVGDFNGRAHFSSRYLFVGKAAGAFRGKMTSCQRPSLGTRFLLSRPPELGNGRQTYYFSSC